MNTIELKGFLIFKDNIVNYFNFLSLKMFSLKLNFSPTYSSHIFIAL